MPGVRQKLQRLSDCALFVVAKRSRTLSHPAIEGCVRQVDAISGGKITDYLIWDEPAAHMVNGLLTKHAIPPAQAILVGDRVEHEQCAEHAKLARFFWAWHYFGDTSVGSA